MPWNPCPPSRGMAAHHPLESVPTMAWNTHTGGHYELLVTALAHGVAGDPNVVGRVDKRRIRFAPAHHGVDKSCITAIPAANPMFP